MYSFQNHSTVQVRTRRVPGSYGDVIDHDASRCRSSTSDADRRRNRCTSQGFDAMQQGDDAAQGRLPRRPRTNG